MMCLQGRTENYSDAYSKTKSRQPCVLQVFWNRSCRSSNVVNSKNCRCNWKHLEILYCLALG